jgi:hypothetical protein
MIKKWGFPLGATLLSAVLAATGYWMLFSSFAVYDDEGYILLSVRDYFAHGHLYEKVYSQYGPAFYVLWDAFQHIIGGPLDHTWARLATLAFWIGTAGGCALLVRRQTNSTSLSLFSFAATFLFLYFITDEPFHPGSLICFVLAISIASTGCLIERQKLTGAAIVAGCTAAFLLLTKINVGVFYFAAVTGWALINASSERVRKISTRGIAVVFIVLAVALMHTLIREAWIQIFVALFASGAIALTLSTKGESLVTPRQAVWFVVSAFTVGLVILFSVWSRGTSLAGLLNGVVLGPLRHPGNYSYPVDWRPGSLFLAGLSLSLAALHPWIARRFPGETADRLIIMLRLITGAALLVGFALLIRYRAVGAIFSYVAPLIWLWVVPLKSIELSINNRAVRSLLAIVLLLQYLHAYPVGGSQESWGAFLFIPLTALGLGDVRLWLIARSSVPSKSFSRWSTAAALMLAVTIGKVSWAAVSANRHYVAGESLQLPGAAHLRLPEIQAASYRVLSLNAVVHGEMLFSLPGMFSFNIWTGLPTPTDKNTTLWFTLLNDEEQQEIVKALINTPRAVIIVQESLLELMQANRIPMRGVLWQYIHRNFSVTFQSNGFAFWVHKERTVAPLNLAKVRDRAGDSLSGLPDTQLIFNFADEGSPIASIEVRHDGMNPQNLQVLDEKNASVILTPINSAGKPTGASFQAQWPITYTGLAHLQIHFDRKALSLSPSDTLLTLKGRQLENLGEMVLEQ